MKTIRASGLRRAFGTLALDRPRGAWPLWLGRSGRFRWAEFRNRGEHLLRNPAGDGFEFSQRWSSELNLGKAIPRAGRQLMAAALEAWPIRFDCSGERSPEREPDVSFVIGHRGEERRPLLLLTLASLRAQEGCRTEIVVVEQSHETCLAGLLPPDVRWTLQRPTGVSTPYSRSAAFNAGVALARGHVVVCHDNDILAPAAYSRELLRLEKAGYEAMRLMRFLFYLAKEDSEALTSGIGNQAALEDPVVPASVRQNLQGGSIALRRDAYSRIGGHDEGFVGWGGEDNEFFDRCRLLRFHPWAYLPFVHLWHPAQLGKTGSDEPGRRLAERLAVSREMRVEELLGRAARSA